MNVPQDLLYTKQHEWVKLDGKNAKVGITDFAQSSLGDITFVELAAKGDKYQQFKQIATVESVKAASDIYAPMSGKVIDLNEEINAHPEVINASPYEKGWFLTIEIENEDEKNNLLNASKYTEYLEEQSK